MGKTVLLSCAISFIVHLLLVGGALAVGLINTRNYRPDIANRWEHVDTLQQEAAFGFAWSPLVLLVSFMGVALVCAVVITILSRLKRVK